MPQAIKSVGGALAKVAPI